MLAPRVAIIYLSYHADQYLDDLVAALQSLTYPKDRVELVIVDNPHPVYGLSVKAIEEKVMPHSGNGLPHVTYLPQEENRGFSGGNNQGVRWAVEHGFDYVYFHNDDGFLAGNALEPLIDAMEKDGTVGVAQSLILLFPETQYINTSGNCFHYLGFGYGNHYHERVDSVPLPPVKEISYASGAASLMRVDLLRTHGAWDEDFFMYHEDCEYSFRLRLLGYRIVLASTSIFYHKYQFSRSMEKFYFMERNRFGLLLLLYKAPTLALLAPMLLLLEAGLWLFAWRGGWAAKRWQVYRYWMKPAHWRLWLEKRKRIQQTRRTGDRELLSYTVPGVYFQVKTMEHPLLTYLGNPVMAVYYWMVRRVVWW